MSGWIDDRLSVRPGNSQIDCRSWRELHGSASAQMTDEQVAQALSNTALYHVLGAVAGTGISHQHHSKSH